MNFQVYQTGVVRPGGVPLLSQGAPLIAPRSLLQNPSMIHGSQPGFSPASSLGANGSLYTNNFTQPGLYSSAGGLLSSVQPIAPTPIISNNAQLPQQFILQTSQQPMMLIPGTFPLTSAYKDEVPSKESFQQSYSTYDQSFNGQAFPNDQYSYNKDVSNPPPIGQYAANQQSGQFTSNQLSGKYGSNHPETQYSQINQLSQNGSNQVGTYDTIKPGIQYPAQDLYGASRQSGKEYGSSIQADENQFSLFNQHEIKYGLSNQKGMLANPPTTLSQNSDSWREDMYEKPDFYDNRHDLGRDLRNRDSRDDRSGDKMREGMLQGIRDIREVMQGQDEYGYPRRGHMMREAEYDVDQPRMPPDCTILDFFNSDLHLKISNDGYMGEALTDPSGFCFCWAGTRANYGVCSGKVCFDVRILEHLEVDFGDDHNESDPHIIRIGWSLDHTSFQLGEEIDSYGYGGTGKFSTNNRFSNYGEPFTIGDIITAYADLDSKPAKLSFAKNGRWLGVASPLHGYKVGNMENALFPHVLTKNCRFEVNFGQRSPWCQSQLDGFTYIDHLPLHLRVRGMTPPARFSDCEMIMIVGLPGAGKTTWGQNMMKDHPDKRYNIIGTDTLIDKMKVMGLPRRNNYHGRWEALIQKATNCLNSLFQIACKRRRNYILDQTNVYATARKRKMKHFSLFKRICAVIQPEDDELKRREWKRTFEDGKVVPEEAVLEMKYNFTLPTLKDEYIDDIIWVELSTSQCQHIIDMYKEEAAIRLPKKDDHSSGHQSWGSTSKWDKSVIGPGAPSYIKTEYGDIQTNNPPPPPPSDSQYYEQSGKQYDPFDYHNQFETKPEVPQLLNSAVVSNVDRWGQQDVSWPRSQVSNDQINWQSQQPQMSSTWPPTSQPWQKAPPAIQPWEQPTNVPYMNQNVKMEQAWNQPPPTFPQQNIDMSKPPPGLLTNQPCDNQVGLLGPVPRLGQPAFRPHTLPPVSQTTMVANINQPHWGGQKDNSNDKRTWNKDSNRQMDRSDNDNRNRDTRTNFNRGESNFGRDRNTRHDRRDDNRRDDRDRRDSRSNYKGRNESRENNRSRDASRDNSRSSHRDRHEEKSRSKERDAGSSTKKSRWGDNPTTTEKKQEEDHKSLLGEPPNTQAVSTPSQPISKPTLTKPVESVNVAKPIEADKPVVTTSNLTTSSIEVKPPVVSTQSLLGAPIRPPIRPPFNRMQHQQQRPISLHMPPHQMPQQMRLPRGMMMPPPPFMRPVSGLPPPPRWQGPPRFR